MSDQEEQGPVVVNRQPLTAVRYLLAPEFMLAAGGIWFRFFALKFRVPGQQLALAELAILLLLIGAFYWHQTVSRLRPQTVAEWVWRGIWFVVFAEMFLFGF